MIELRDAPNARCVGGGGALTARPGSPGAIEVVMRGPAVASRGERYPNAHRCGI